MHCHTIVSTNDLPYITNEVGIQLYLKHPYPGRYCQNYHVVHPATCGNSVMFEQNEQTNE
jgi:hypothetical protein